MKAFLSFGFVSLLLSVSISSFALGSDGPGNATNELKLVKDMTVNSNSSSVYEMPEYIVYGYYGVDNPELKSETKKLDCYSYLVQFSVSVKDAEKAPTTKAEAGTVFKIVSTQKVASDSFLDPLAIGTQGLTIIKLKSTSEEYGLELSCHTKEKYYLDKNSLSHAPSVENVLKIFNSKIN